MNLCVLGSAAGGGSPQWNCGCANCVGLRAGTLKGRARTQESVALASGSGDWFVVNASPEIRQQIESFPGLHPRGPRHSPIAGILLTNGDLDHCLGLLSLRESHPLHVWATAAVARGFREGNVLYRTLERFPGQVTWHELPLDREIPLTLPSGAPSGLLVEAVPVPGKPPVHLEGIAPGDPGEGVGLRVREAATGRRLAYFSGVGAVTDPVRKALADADALFFDGTFWTSDELIALGLGTKRAEAMAHLPVNGPGGSLAALGDIWAERRVFIHINNTNPILREDSPERGLVEAAGWEVAWDGMEIVL